MPIEFGIWRIDGDVVPVPSSHIENEAKLEDILEADLSILGLDVLLLIGRQVITALGKRIDLMAMDANGDLYAIELKKDRTPREVVAQALDYGYWLRDWIPRASSGSSRSTIANPPSIRPSENDSIRTLQRI